MHIQDFDDVVCMASDLYETILDVRIQTLRSYSQTPLNIVKFPKPWEAVCLINTLKN